MGGAYKTRKELLAATDTVAATATDAESHERALAFGEIGERARHDRQSNAESNKEIDARIKSGDIKVSDWAKAYRSKMMELSNLQGSLTGEDSASNREIWGKIRDVQEGLSGMRGGTIEEQLKKAQELGDVGDIEGRSRILSDVGVQKKIAGAGQREKWGQKGAVAETVLGTLGGQYDKGEFKDLKGAGSVATMMERLGLGKGSKVSAAEIQSIQKELTAITEGKEYVDREGSEIKPGEERGKWKTLSDREKGERLNALRSSAGIIEGAKEQEVKKYADSEEGHTMLEIRDGIKALGQALTDKTLKVRVMSPVDIAKEATERLAHGAA
jgi:hypothetical protein